MLQVFIFTVLFFIVSMIFSMFGLGGGLIYVPMLVLGGYPVKVASIISLFAITLASSSAFITFFRSGKFDWKLAAIIDPPTDIMAFVGGYYANILDEHILNLTLVIVILVAGLLIIKQPKGRSIKLKWEKFTWKRTFKNEIYQVNIPIVCFMTGLIGFFVGMVGATGGVFKIPIMVLLCGVPMDIAVGTSSGMVFLTAIFGLAGHLMTANKINWLVMMLISVACLIGGILGAKISLKIDRKKLRLSYGFLMFMLAILTILKRLFLPI